MPLRCFASEHMTISVSFFSPFDLRASFHPKEFQFSSPLAMVNRLKNGWQTVALICSVCQKLNLSLLGLHAVARSALREYKAPTHSP